MREILFRGKRKDNGKWVHGTLNNVLDEVPRIQYAVIEHGMMFLADFDVIPETVGQYTGLKDLHGTRIFEGDIVRFIDIDFDGSERKAVGVIAWNRKAANFDIVKGTYRLDFHYPVFEEIEVIGNVYDNQELLEEDKT